MKLGIMQPYFFPYIGYFQLMNAVDRWIVFDDIQFRDKGWVNRNRVLHPDPKKEWQFITVPLDNRAQFDKICDISVKSEIQWKSQILGKLTHYKKKAPYYAQTINFVRDCLDTDDANLSRLLISILKKTRDYLGITTPIDIQSEMRLQLLKIQHAGQWALRISEALGAKEYVNPSGGQQIFNPSEFEDANIKLSFLSPGFEAYCQRRADFIAGLSIIDVLMFTGREQAAMLLEGYKLD
jgi:hypothetical protein